MRNRLSTCYFIFLSVVVSTALVLIPPPAGITVSDLARIGFLIAGALGVLLAFLMVRFRQKIDMVRANEAFRREFTANVTHELRTPLTSILGAVEMLGDGSDLSEAERRELFDIVREQANRLNALSGDILSLAQLERGQQEATQAFEPVDLCVLLDRVIDLESAKAKTLGMELCRVAADAAVVSGDPQLLEQALVNLVENAFRYSGSSRVELGCQVRNRRAVLSVTDYGIGIPARHLPRLFERFYRVDKARSRALGGTGLGLAIVKHVVQLHGGEVSVTSEQGVCTQFHIVLPVPHGQPVRVESPLKSPPADVSAWRGCL